MIRRFVARRFGVVVIIGLCLLAASALLASAQPETSARVTGTGGDGLVLRAEADRNSAQLFLEPEGAVVAVIGPEQTTSGRSWLPVRDVQGRIGWLASEYLAPEAVVLPTPTSITTIVAVEIPPPVEPTSTRIPKPIAKKEPDPEPEPEVGLPVTVELRFKLPEVDRRDKQVLFVNISRNSVPVQDVAVRFIVEDEDPEVEREASTTDSNGRSNFEWSMRKYRGTTTVRVTALAPDGGTGKASRSFFVK